MRTREYKTEDYEGEFNIARHEKELVLRAFVKYSGNMLEMASALRITSRSLYDRVYAHKLEDIFTSKDPNRLIISMIQDLVRLNIPSY